MKASWKGTVIAVSDDIEELDGIYYFPLDSIKKEFFIESSNCSHCPQKGKVQYLHLMVEGEIKEDAAWYCVAPGEEAEIFKDRIAFTKEIEFKESSRKINWEMIKVLNTFF